MTIHNLFVADLGDLLHIQLECKCGAKVSLTPDDGKLPHHCPQCETGWRTMQNNYESELLDNFIHALKKAREQQKSSPNLRVGLVFDSSKQSTK